MGATLTKQEKATEYLREAIEGRTLYTLTDYGRGETDYVRVFITTGADKLREISYLVKAACDMRMSERGIRVGGCQYNKGHHVADSAAWICFGREVAQGDDPGPVRWRAL